jgi:hypothetical protein
VILSDSINPWPMTLTPTNEAIRRETMQKKTLWVKKDHYDLGVSWLGVRILFINLAYDW